MEKQAQKSLEYRGMELEKKEEKLEQHREQVHPEKALENKEGELEAGRQATARALPYNLIPCLGADLLMPRSPQALAVTQLPYGSQGLGYVFSLLKQTYEDAVSSGTGWHQATNRQQARVCLQLLCSGTSGRDVDLVEEANQAKRPS